MKSEEFKCFFSHKTIEFFVLHSSFFTYLRLASTSASYFSMSAMYSSPTGMLFFNRWNRNPIITQIT